MPKTTQDTHKRITPARTPEARERQMINYAIDLAEKQLREGTASSQVITHFLRLATENARLERENLKSDLDLKRAKTKQIEQQQNLEKVYTNAIAAMKGYMMPQYNTEDI